MNAFPLMNLRLSRCLGELYPDRATVNFYAQICICILALQALDAEYPTS